MKFKAIVLVLALALCHRTAPAIGTARTETTGDIRVAVWGEVVSPGQYYLSGSPDLLELLSVAGGPTADANLSNILLIRERDGTRQRLNLSRITAEGELLFLTSGDVIVVSQSFWHKVQRNLPLITTLVTLTNLVVTVTLLVAN